jgi:predicted HicB family RNase H-like nuclease
VVIIRDVVNFYGGSAKAVRTEFRRSVEEYLAVCREEGIAPDKPYSARFNVRLPPELHRAVAEASADEGKRLNAWVADELARAVRNAPAVAVRGAASTRGARSPNSPTRNVGHTRAER